jgi:hypothetical protein
VSVSEGKRKEEYFCEGKARERKTWDRAAPHMRRTRAAHLDKVMALCSIKTEKIAVDKILSCRVAGRIS